MTDNVGKRTSFKGDALHFAIRNVSVDWIRVEDHAVNGCSMILIHVGTDAFGGLFADRFGHALMKCFQRLFLKDG